MPYKIFLDDERWPPQGTGAWVICRTCEQFEESLRLTGCPSYISFDHDLGPNKKTGKDAVNALIDMVLDEEIVLPDDFAYYVHSQNPIGKKNIEGLMDQFLQQFKMKG